MDICQLQVREATTEDMDQIFTVLKKMIRECDDHDCLSPSLLGGCGLGPYEIHIRAHILASNRTLLLLELTRIPSINENNKQPIIVGIASLQEHKKNGPFRQFPGIVVTDFYILHECRRQGYGSFLLGLIKLHARRKDYQFVECMLSGWKEEAYHFYQVMGARFNLETKMCVMDSVVFIWSPKVESDLLEVELDSDCKMVVGLTGAANSDDITRQILESSTQHGVYRDSWSWMLPLKDFPFRLLGDAALLGAGYYGWQHGSEIVYQTGSSVAVVATKCGEALTLSNAFKYMVSKLPKWKLPKWF